MNILGGCLSGTLCLREVFPANGRFMTHTSSKVEDSSPAGREHNEVRTFFENSEEEIKIPIYNIPVQR